MVVALLYNNIQTDSVNRSVSSAQCIDNVRFYNFRPLASTNPSSERIPISDMTNVKPLLQLQ